MCTVEIAINACDLSKLSNNPYKKKNISGGEMKMSTINNYNNNNTCSSSKNAAATINLDLTNGSNASIYECSSIASSDNDLSFSLAIDREVAAINNLNIDSDELPVFEIRLLSPTGTSTPSPISCDNNNRVKSASSCIKDGSPTLRRSPCESNPEFVALSEINAQISPPSEYSTPTNLSLETIYEGVFLNTPPRTTRSRLQHTPKSGNRGSPRNLLEKFVVNRCLQLSTKDNQQQSPLSQLSNKAAQELKEANAELHQKTKT